MRLDARLRRRACRCCTFWPSTWCRVDAPTVAERLLVDGLGTSVDLLEVERLLADCDVEVVDALAAERLLVVGDDEAADAAMLAALATTVAVAMVGFAAVPVSRSISSSSAAGVGNVVSRAENACEG